MVARQPEPGARRFMPHFEIRERVQEGLVVITAMFWRPTGNPAHPEVADLTMYTDSKGVDVTPWHAYVRSPNWFERIVQRRTFKGKVDNAKRCVQRAAEKRMARLREQNLVVE